MKKNIIYLLLLVSTSLLAQVPTQSIKGTVRDKDNKQALIGASIVVSDVTPMLGAVSDIDGNFSIENVPLGRHKITCSYVGYGDFVADNVIISSAKSLQLDIELTEAATSKDEVVITAFKHGNEALNELSLVSTRSFSVEETQRYAASANDPGRMAMGFPGVQVSRDNRSDIVIRGNSSAGMLWRLEGIDIPNPNHFARKGSSGGGLTIFSVSMMDNSDFSTGAFPAEYGNALSGVFDVHFRKGNREKREYSLRAGLLGLDFSTEGPIKQGRSSYLVNYRYSTLGILNKLGVHLVGPRIDNSFQDLSFNLLFPSKNNRSIVSVWGIGGTSFEKQRAESDTWKNYDDYAIYNFKTDMGAVGATHTWLIDDKSYLKSSLAVMGQRILFQDDTLNNQQEQIAYRVNDEDYKEGRYSLSSFYNRKINKSMTLKTGVFASNLWYDLSASDQYNGQYVAAKGNTFLIQPYANLRYQPNEKLNINVGVHSMFLTLNNTQSVEPRLGIRYQLSSKQSLSLAFGLHGRILPIGSYFTRDTASNLVNKELDIIKSRHLVLAYEYQFNKSWRTHVELYYQSLYNVPVSPDTADTYWMLNDIQGFATQALVSEGKGRNVGLDLSLEKSFDKGLFVLLSGSVFNSTYQALNGKRYNTQYNSRLSGALMGGKEWAIGTRSTLQTSLKLLFNGGSPIQPLAADPGTDPNRPLLDATRPFAERVPAYFRGDVRIAYRRNNAKSAWVLALDVQNATLRSNIDGLSRRFDPITKSWVYRVQKALVPLLSFQIDF